MFVSTFSHLPRIDLHQEPELFYVEDKPNKGHKTLCDARCAAGLSQRMGVHRSLTISQNGQIVDLKRF